MIFLKILTCHDDSKSQTEFYWIVGLMKPKLADKHRLKIKNNLRMILCCLQNEDMIRLYKEALKFDENLGSPDPMSRSILD